MPSSRFATCAALDDAARTTQCPFPLARQYICRSGCHSLRNELDFFLIRFDTGARTLPNRSHFTWGVSVHRQAVRLIAPHCLRWQARFTNSLLNWASGSLPLPMSKLPPHVSVHELHGGGGAGLPASASNMPLRRTGPPKPNIRSSILPTPPAASPTAVALTPRFAQREHPTRPA